MSFEREGVRGESGLLAPPAFMFMFPGAIVSFFLAAMLLELSGDIRLSLSVAVVS